MEAATQTASETSQVTADRPVDPETNPAALDRFNWLPCEMSLEIPIAKFTVGDLLDMSKGTILETACHCTHDIPLRANGLLIGWTEFEVVGNKLAVRITELA